MSPSEQDLSELPTLQLLDLIWRIDDKAVIDDNLTKTFLSKQSKFSTIYYVQTEDERGKLPKAILWRRIDWELDVKNKTLADAKSEKRRWVGERRNEEIKRIIDTLSKSMNPDIASIFATNFYNGREETLLIGMRCEGVKFERELEEEYEELKKQSNSL